VRAGIIGALRAWTVAMISAFVDPLQINRGDAEVGVPQLALDDVERDALVGEFDGVGVAELLRRELIQSQDQGEKQHLDDPKARAITRPRTREPARRSPPSAGGWVRRSRGRKRRSRMNGGGQSSASRRINSPIPHWSSPQGISHPPLRLPAVETAFCLSEKRVALSDADVEAWAVAGEDPGDGIRRSLPISRVSFGS
jgi:hypothetical protein